MLFFEKKSMKKSFFLLFSVLFLVSCQTKKTKNTDWQNDDLIGKVKSYRITNYLAMYDLGEVVRGDEIGALGRIVYNESGFRIEEFWSFNEEISHRVYNYNEDGNCIESICYNQDKTVKDYGKFSYDKNGNIQEEVFYDSADKLISKYVYTTDKNGNVTDQLEFNQNEELEVSHSSKYNSSSLETEHITCFYENGNRMFTKQTFAYNLSGKITESILFDDERNILSQWVYSYNEQGSLVSEEVFDSDKKLTEKRTYTYEYDSVGNWTTRISYNAITSDAQVITVRKIEYFN